MSNVITVGIAPILNGTITVASMFIGYLGSNKWLMTINQINPSYKIDYIIEVGNILSITPSINYLSSNATLISNSNPRTTNYIVPLTDNMFLRFLSGVGNVVELWNLNSNNLELLNSYDIAQFGSNWSHHRVSDNKIFQAHGISNEHFYRINELDTNTFTFSNPNFLSDSSPSASPSMLFSKGLNALYSIRYANSAIRSIARLDLSTQTITNTTSFPTTITGFPVNFGVGADQEFLVQNNGDDFFVQNAADLSDYAAASSSWRSNTLNHSLYNSFAIDSQFAFFQRTVSGLGAQFGIIKKNGATLVNTTNTMTSTDIAISGRTILRIDNNFLYGNLGSQAIYRVSRPTTTGTNFLIEIYKP